MALIGHSGSHRVQSMHSSGLITRKLGPSWKASTGQTSTQSVYLHLMQLSVTTKVMLSRAYAGSRGPCQAGSGAPYAVRTRVPALRGRCPRPLDEGSEMHRSALVYRNCLARQCL